MHERDRHTDGQTDTAWRHRSRLHSIVRQKQQELETENTEQTRRVFAGWRSRRLDRSLLEPLRPTDETLNDVAHFFADVLAQSRRRQTSPADNKSQHCYIATSDTPAMTASLDNCPISPWLCRTYLPRLQFSQHLTHLLKSFVLQQSSRATPFLSTALLDQVHLDLSWAYWPLAPTIHAWSSASLTSSR